MSGHSKWHNIKIKKNKVDAQRGKIFTKVSKEIMLAVREGGPDPEANYRLATVIQKAKMVNMPGTNIKRAIEKASGAHAGSDDIMEAIYEGYGPHGVAVLVEVATDNRNRTIPELKNIFSKYGGAMGELGCVSWMFEKKGVISVKFEDVDEDSLIETALEAGALDVKAEDGYFEVLTEPSTFFQVRKIMEEKGINMESAELTMIPQNEIKLDRNQAESIMKMMDAFEENDDVQNVHANFDIPEEVMQEMEAGL